MAVNEKEKIAYFFAWRDQFIKKELYPMRTEKHYNPKSNYEGNKRHGSREWHETLDRIFPSEELQPRLAVCVGKDGNHDSIEHVLACYLTGEMVEKDDEIWFKIKDKELI